MRAFSFTLLLFGLLGLLAVSVPTDWNAPNANSLGEYNNGLRVVKRAIEDPNLGLESEDDTFDADLKNDKLAAAGAEPDPRRRGPGGLRRLRRSTRSRSRSLTTRGRPQGRSQLSIQNQRKTTAAPTGSMERTASTADAPWVMPAHSQLKITGELCRPRRRRALGT